MRRRRASATDTVTRVDSLYAALSLTPRLLALVAPACAFVAGLRLRVIVAIALVPLVLVLVATLISAHTSWGSATAHGSDDLTNTGRLVYLAFFTVVAELAGLVAAAVTAVVSRVVRSRRTTSA